MTGKILADTFLYSGLIGMMTIDSGNRFAKIIYKSTRIIFIISLTAGLFVWFR